MLTAREPLPTLLTSESDALRLSELYGPCFTLILQLRATTEFGDAEVLRDRIERLLRQAEREAKQRGYDAADVRDASFAVVAFIDETVQLSDWSHRKAWLDRPLQLERYDRNDAGEEFFARLDALRAKPEGRPEVLEVYYLCMVLGFEGRYRLQRQGELRLLIENTYEKLRRGESGVLAPHALPDEEPLEVVRTALPAWLALAAALALGVLLYAGLSLWVSGSAGDAAEAIYPAAELPATPVDAAPEPDAAGGADDLPDPDDSMAEPVLDDPDLDDPDLTEPDLDDPTLDDPDRP